MKPLKRMKRLTRKQHQNEFLFRYP